ncbi:MAG: lysoplasmalogenase [Clostridia bacterium]|nr:lysoplasmalogenase [Clostridia bacterium]
MNRTRKLHKVILVLNLVLMAAIFALNFVYQSNGFDFTLKCVCSGGFALMGVINLGYALLTKRENPAFSVSMAAGLLLAMLGDILIGYNFIVGAGTFALGHICFVIAYCLLQRMKWQDLAIGGALFVAATAFLLFCPLLTFEVPLFKVVCIIYALIISAMLGKAVGNFIRERSLFYGLVALASLLFFFSDLMLVFDWFIGLWDWTDHACMGTYYPALCFLAVSMCVKAGDEKNTNG